MNQPCNETVKALQEENASLRNSLIDIQSKLASLTVSSLSVKVSKDLGESVPEEPSNADVSSREYAYMGSALGNKLDLKEFHSVHPSNVPYVTPRQLFIFFAGSMHSGLASYPVDVEIKYT